jgi:lipoprotein-anchoring transpeptidase ErfK/SrfK
MLRHHILQRAVLLLTLGAVVLGYCAPAVWAEVTISSLEQPTGHYASAPVDFFAAAATGNLPAIRQALAAGVFVDAPVPKPLPPELATEFNSHTRVAWLLNEQGTTALMLATANGKSDVVAELLSAKANREARTRSGIRPLDIAAERSDTAMMQLLLGVTPESDAARLSIVVDLGTQRATLSRDGQPVLVTKVSSGKKEKPTPPGKYVVTQKYTEWRSTLYHNASMPFFLRLSCTAVGLHAGVVPDYPASHGCVRLPADVARKFYEIVPRGTLVEIR